MSLRLQMPQCDPSPPIFTSRSQTQTELTVSLRFCSSNGRQPVQTFYSKIMLVKVTAEPVSGVKAWP